MRYWTTPDMEYLVENIIKEVKVALDENVSSTALADIGDVDTLTNDEIIASKVVDAARIVMVNAPVHLLDNGKPFGESIAWDDERCCGKIHLPDDFLRLVSFKMSDWDMAVTVAITEESPLYLRQQSSFAGVRGNCHRPIVAITQQPVGLVLEFYSCSSCAATITRARYIPMPRIRNHRIEVPEKLKAAIVYYIAYLTALTTGNGNGATACLAIAKELAELGENG